jgi:hypothetical protein
MARTKKEKVLTPRLEMRHLREQIAARRDSHKADLRREITPLAKRLAVLVAAQALRRAEKALLKTVTADKAAPQLELLALPVEEQKPQAELPLATQ